MQSVVYDEDDVERFLDVQDMIDETSDRIILDKLLHVQNKISIIANIESDDLRAIVYDLKFINYKYRDFIIKEGDVSQEIFFILSGECQAFVKKKKVGVLQKGKAFGESAAIFNTKRNASVVCSSKEGATLLSFSIDHENMDFCAEALAKIYKNLAYQINVKLESMNQALVNL